MSYIISITVHIHGYWNVWVQFHLHITTITPLLTYLMATY